MKKNFLMLIILKLIFQLQIQIDYVIKKLSLLKIIILKKMENIVEFNLKLNIYKYCFIKTLNVYYLITLNKY